MLNNAGDPLKKDSDREYAGWVSKEITTDKAKATVNICSRNKYTLRGADEGCVIRGC